MQFLDLKFYKLKCNRYYYSISPNLSGINRSQISISTLHTPSHLKGSGDIVEGPGSLLFNKRLESDTEILLEEELITDLNADETISRRSNLNLENDSNNSILKHLKARNLLSNSDKNNYQLSSFLIEVLVGKLLGDAHMRKFNISDNSKSNARVIFLQSLEQSELIHKLYELFKDFTVSPPKINSSLIK